MPITDARRAGAFRHRAHQLTEQATREWRDTGVAITLAGVQTQHVSLMLIGTIVAGIGFGAAFSGSMRTVMPNAEAHERAGLLAPIAGLPLAADVYGAVVIVLALGSLLAMVRSA